MNQKYVHKISGLKGKTSMTVVLPQKILQDLEITRGTHVIITQEQEKIIIKKLTD